MKRLLLLIVILVALLGGCGDGCDPATQPCDVDLSTRKPQAPVEQPCYEAHGAELIQVVCK